MKQLQTLLLCFSMLFGVVSTTHAQTAGSGDLSSIESKANSIEENRKKIKDLESKIQASYQDETAKLNKIKKQLSDLRTEKSNALYELRNGFYCSKCNTPKSEFESRGESFTAHLNSVSGRAVPASQEVIQKKMDEYDRKIEAKEEEIRKFTYEENEFVRKRAEWAKQIQDLKDRNASLCQEITALSNSYKTKVVAEGKSIQTNLSSELMRFVADKHYIEDRLDIIAVKLNELASEEQKALSEIRDKVYKKNEENKKNLGEKIESNKMRLTSLENSHNQRLAAARGTLSGLQSRLNDVNRALANASQLKPEEVEKLQQQKTELTERIDAEERQIEQYEADYKRSSDAIEQENRELSDKIWQLTVNLSKLQDEAAENVRKAFATKRTILTDARAARTKSLELAGGTLLSKKSSYRQKFMDYAKIVDNERIRLVRACQKAECSCYGYDTHGTVVSNWNSAESCVGQMESAHFSSDPIYGCTEETAAYRQYYASLINGLSDADIQALQKKSSRTRFDLIFKKVTN